MASCVASRVFKEGINWDAFKSMDDFENLNHVASPSAIFEGGKVERPKSLYVRTVADVINHFGSSLLHPLYGFGVCLEARVPYGISVIYERSDKAFVQLWNCGPVSALKAATDAGEYSVGFLDSICHMVMEF